jgi:hypothetical protein
MRLIFPTIIIALNVCAALFYLPDEDWRRVAYWIAAAVLNFSVTY